MGTNYSGRNIIYSDKITILNYIIFTFTHALINYTLFCIHVITMRYVLIIMNVSDNKLTILFFYRLITSKNK